MATNVGVVFPSPQFLKACNITMPYGKKRALAYAVCTGCVEAPDVGTQVEQRIMAQAAAVTN